MRWLLLLVLLAGLALRAANLDFGLDLHELSRAILSHQQDEEGMARQVLSGTVGSEAVPPSRGLLRDDPSPGVFLLWGALGGYTFAAADSLVLRPLSRWHEGGWDGLLAELDVNPSLLHLVHRSVSVLAAMLALLALGRMGRRLLGERGGLVVVAIAAASYLPAREAHFGTLDTLGALWIVLAIEQALRLCEEPTAMRSCLAGLFTGLAAATKYSGAAVVLPVAAAHLLAAPRLGARRTLLRLLLAGGVAGAAVLACMPQILTTPEIVLSALRYQRDTIGIQLEQGGGTWELAGYHLVYTFGAGFGETALLFAAIGGWLLWRRGGAARMAALAVPLLLPMFFVVRSPAVRYGSAPVLLRALPAAACCEAAGAALARWRLRPAAGVLLATALCVGPSLLRTVSFDRVLGRTDTRTEALQWLAELNAPKQEVFAFGFTGLPRPGLVAKWPPPYVDYLRVVQSGRWFTREEGKSMRPRWLLRDETSAGADPWGWVDWVDTAAREYRVVRRLEPRNDPAAVNLPDAWAGTPSFYLPYTNPWVMDRPGPVLTLYERIEPPAER
jgi:hypothetical protein